MFDVGFWELALIAVVALLVVGPERLPALARSVGLWVGKIRRYTDHVRREVERDFKAHELREMIEKPAPLDDVYDAVRETKEALREAEQELNVSTTAADVVTGNTKQAEAISANATESVGAEAKDSSRDERESRP